MSDLPFKLCKDHKPKMNYKWKQRGLITDNFEEIYNKYIRATHCELCGKEFTKSIDRQMEHNHETGEFRNIVCNRCNTLKNDRKVRTDNTSGYKAISKKKCSTCKQGFTWYFRAIVNGKSKFIKSSNDLDKLVEFAEKWKKDNNYHK